MWHEPSWVSHPLFRFHQSIIEIIQFWNAVVILIMLNDRNLTWLDCTPSATLDSWFYLNASNAAIFTHVNPFIHHRRWQKPLVRCTESTLWRNSFLLMLVKCWFRCVAHRWRLRRFIQFRFHQMRREWNYILSTPFFLVWFTILLFCDFNISVWISILVSFMTTIRKLSPVQQSASIIYIFYVKGRKRQIFFVLYNMIQADSWLFFVQTLT